MAKKKKPPLISQPALGDFLLVHVPYDDWFLRKVYISEGGERRARLIDQDQNRARLYKVGLRQARSEQGRLLQLIKSEIRGSKELYEWEVIADYVTEQ
jgi:hypothetical protein